MPLFASFVIKVAVAGNKHETGIVGLSFDTIVAVNAAGTLTSLAVSTLFHYGLLFRGLQAHSLVLVHVVLAAGHRSSQLGLFQELFVSECSL